MSTTLHFLLAVFFGIINAQTFEDCGSKSITVGTNNNQETLTIQLERDLTNSEVRITLTGPTDKWFGFVIGQGTMGGGYGVYGSGNANYGITEQSLAYQQGGGNSLSSSGTDTVTTGANENVLTLVRPFSVSPGNYYDFSNLLGPQCSSKTMAFAGVIGNTLNYAKHAFETANQLFTSTCSCPTDPPTTDPTADPTNDPTNTPTYDPTMLPTTYDPTMDPTDDPTMDPTTYAPTMQPTTDPTDDPTVEGQTRDPSMEPTEAPTSDPTSDPTQNPTDITTTFMETTGFTSTEGMTSTIMSTMITDISSTEEMDDGYELCATSELITGYKLNVFRNTEEMMVGIMMSGTSDVWFGYGFGSPVMTDSYGVTVEAADSADPLDRVVERTLDKSSSPGTLLDVSGNTTVTVNDSIALAYFLRPYTVTNDGFDFTDFMECNVDSVDLIAAFGSVGGSGTKMGYHGSRVDERTMTRLSTCTCAEDVDPTDDPANDDTTSTKLPTDGNSANNIFNVFSIMAIVSASIYAIMMT